MPPFTHEPLTASSAWRLAGLQCSLYLVGAVCFFVVIFNALNDDWVSAAALTVSFLWASTVLIRLVFGDKFTLKRLTGADILALDDCAKYSPAIAETLERWSADEHVVLRRRDQWAVWTRIRDKGKEREKTDPEYRNLMKLLRRYRSPYRK